MMRALPPQPHRSCCDVQFGVCFTLSLLFPVFLFASMANVFAWSEWAKDVDPGTSTELAPISFFSCVSVVVFLCVCAASLPPYITWSIQHYASGRRVSRAFCGCCALAVARVCVCVRLCLCVHCCSLSDGAPDDAFLGVVVETLVRNGFSRAADLVGATAASLDCGENFKACHRAFISRAINMVEAPSRFAPRLFF